MKFLQTIAIAFLIITGLQCKKNSKGTDVPGLPPATQSGANTFGFLLNGVPWTPAGNNGTANLSIDYDPGINNGYLSISAYNISNANREYIIVACRDSLNFISNLKKTSISKSSLGYCLYVDNNFCRRNSDDSLQFTKGSLTITKHDKVARVIAGFFECTLFNAYCGDTVEISSGRFDFKF